MAALVADESPQHAGDVELPCPACGDTIAVPVFCELVDGDRPGALTIRCEPSMSPVHEHVRKVHGVRLSRRRTR